MRMTRLHAPTLKDDPNDAEVVGHRLLVRGGIFAVAAGIYDYLPLGQRVLRKIQGIIREEMDRAGAQRYSCRPCSHQTFGRSGRWGL